MLPPHYDTFTHTVLPQSYRNMRLIVESILKDQKSHGLIEVIANPHVAAFSRKTNMQYTEVHNSFPEYVHAARKLQTHCSLQEGSITQSLYFAWLWTFLRVQDP